MNLRLLLSFLCCVFVSMTLTDCSNDAPCLGAASSLTLDPNSSPCTKHCDCSNQLYEGVCLEGVCKSVPRENCSGKGKQRQCIPTQNKDQTCKLGIQRCHPDYLDSDKWGNCEPLEKLAKESDGEGACGDGQDNDCDGKVDKADPDCKDFCNPGETAPCFTNTVVKPTNIGLCKTGIKVCGSKSKWGECFGSVDPKEKEECNGLDDDCNGKVDDGLTDCKGCQPIGAKEICFGGTTAQQKEGICKTGIRTCESTGSTGGVWGTCEGERLPGTEKCNSLDDDCNGKIDDGLTDCDGCLTPGARRLCFGGTAGQQNVGRCKPGFQICAPDPKDEKIVKWGACEGEILSKPEECNGFDDDCNGKVDDGLTDCKGCQPVGSTQPCFDGPAGTLNVGICKGGTQTCINDGKDGGKWGACQGQILPLKSEVCNGVDDDCDGLIDNESTGNSKKLKDCDCWPPGGVETCYDGKPGTETKGICHKGARICQTDGKWGPCLKQQIPLAEECNLKDDDCDGQIDNASGSGANTLSRICFNSLTGCTRQLNGALKCVGSCQAGTQMCLNGNWSRCEGEQTPTQETCNGLDDDCNGQVDDSLKVLPLCPNQKAGCAGSRFSSSSCVGGSWKLDCSDAEYKTQFPQFNRSLQETCDNLDNNCSGQINEDTSTASCVGTIAGLGQGAESGWGTEARFYRPRGITADKDGNLYVADTDNQVIRKIDPCGHVTLFAGTFGIFGLQDGQGAQALFYEPTDVAVDKSGNVYVADSKNHRIRKIDKNGVVSTLAGGAAGFLDARGLSARFSLPKGLAIDANGVLFIADTNNQRIRKIDQSGNVTTVAGAGTNGFKDGPGASALFNFPEGLVVDPRGSVLYVADTRNFRIRKISLNGGAVSTYAGSGTNGVGDGAFLATQFQGPRDISMDSQGNLYVVDATLSGTLGRLRKIDVSAQKVETPFNTRVLHTDGPQASALFLNIVGVAVDGHDNVVLTDTHRIRRYQLKGFKAERVCAITYAGSDRKGYKDGRHAGALFDKPGGIAQDEAGNVYVADTNNHRIRKIDLLGNVTTIAGTGGAGFRDGLAGFARFDSPTGVAVDKQGNVYVADTNNNRIRKIDTSGTVSTYAGTGKFDFKDGPAATAFSSTQKTWLWMRSAMSMWPIAPTTGSARSTKAGWSPPSQVRHQVS